MAKKINDVALRARAEKISAILAKGLESYAVKGGTVDADGKKVDNGKFGEFIELWAAGTLGSGKTGISAQGEADLHIVVNGTPRRTECKTGGGTLNLADLKKNGYVIYCTLPHQYRANGKGQAYAGNDIPPVIMATETFLKVVHLRTDKKMVATANATAVQVSSKVMYLKILAGLEEGTIQYFEPNKAYTF